MKIVLVGGPFDGQTRTVAANRKQWSGKSDPKGKLWEFYWRGNGKREPIRFRYKRCRVEPPDEMKARCPGPWNVRRRRVALVA